MLYVFEDNEAVIKMIIKGRCHTMRHVSRTHRVALDWLLDRVNLDPKIQIRYIDSKHQLADILTKGNCMRDEWNNLLHLFNISRFSSLRCTKDFSWLAALRWQKRIQEQKKEKGLYPSRDVQWMFLLILLRQVPPPHQVRLHRKVWGCLELRRDPIAGWVLNQAHSTQRRFLKCDSRMHTLAGWWKSSRETWRMRKKIFRRK